MLRPGIYTFGDDGQGFLKELEGLQKLSLSLLRYTHFQTLHGLVEFLRGGIPEFHADHVALDRDVHDLGNDPVNFLDPFYHLQFRELRRVRSFCGSNFKAA